MSMSESIVLDIRDLKSHFFTAKGEIPAVDGVSIEVPAGKIIGIVGESGCGKSMTAMSVMGLLRHPGKVVGGTITLDGRDITHLSSRELAKGTLYLNSEVYVAWGIDDVDTILRLSFDRTVVLAMNGPVTGSSC